MRGHSAWGRVCCWSSQRMGHTSRMSKTTTAVWPNNSPPRKEPQETSRKATGPEDVPRSSAAALPAPPVVTLPHVGLRTLAIPDLPTSWPGGILLGFQVSLHPRPAGLGGPSFVPQSTGPTHGNYPLTCHPPSGKNRKCVCPVWPYDPIPCTGPGAKQAHDTWAKRK